MKTELLEVAFKVLKQIADHKRRTREQRLASACVRFLDSLDESSSNMPNITNECVNNLDEWSEELFKELANEQK